MPISRPRRSVESQQRYPFLSRPSQQPLEVEGTTNQKKPRECTELEVLCSGHALDAQVTGDVRDKGRCWSHLLSATLAERSVQVVIIARNELDIRTQQIYHKIKQKHKSNEHCDKRRRPPSVEARQSISLVQSLQRTSMAYCISTMMHWRVAACLYLIQQVEERHTKPFYSAMCVEVSF